MNRSLTRICACLSLLTLLFTPRVLKCATGPQGDRIAQLEDLIVVVRARVTDDDKIGTGIIFGASANRLYRANKIQNACTAG